MLLRNGTRWWLECLGLCAGARPPARLRALGSSRWRPGPTHAHVNPLIRAWALSIAGYVRYSGLRLAIAGSRATTHHARHRIRQSADPFSQNGPFSPFFTQWVCTLAATPPEVAAAPSPTGGNDAIQASDTPATRRQRASHGAKPPPPPVWRARAASKTGTVPVRAKKLAQHGPSSGLCAKKLAQHA